MNVIVYVLFVGQQWNRIHFMFECPAYDITRNEFLTNIAVNRLNNSVDKLRCCMDLHQRSTAKYIVKIWNERRNLMVAQG